jgi:hypothetical protein
VLRPFLRPAVPGAVLAPPVHGGHVGQTPIGSVPFEELRVVGGVVRLPLDGANADVEAGELPLPGLLELLGRGRASVDMKVATLYARAYA